MTYANEDVVAMNTELVSDLEKCCYLCLSAGAEIQSVETLSTGACAVCRC